MAQLYIHFEGRLGVIIRIYNNPVENAIRPIAIGKKNWLFSGSEQAGKRTAAILLLFTTVKLNGIDPAPWLTETLEKLPPHPNSKIDELFCRFRI